MEKRRQKSSRHQDNALGGKGFGPRKIARKVGRLIEAVKKQLSRLAYRISYREETDEDHWKNSFKEAVNSPVGPSLLEIRSFIDHWYDT